MLKKLSLTILFPLITFGVIYAQKAKTFSEDPVKFPQELTTYIQETKSDEIDEITKKFNALWQAKKYSADQQQGIYRTANKMLAKRMKPYPEFFNYVRALISIANTKQTAASFDAWQDGLDRLLDGPSKYFNSFINSCNELFNQSYIYSSSTTKWYANTDSYEFAYDSLPKIIFPNLDLICRAKNDSAVILGTKGVYYPNKNKWYGSGGKVTWERAGISADTVWADLKIYKIDVKGSDYDADSVLFYHKGFFKAPLKGRLIDKILANVTEEKATYPRFSSYNTNIELKNLATDVTYRGGFSQHGAKFLGSGTKDHPASLTFYRNKKAFVVCTALGFSMKPLRFSSENAAFKMYIGQHDSITHPGIQLRYLKEKRELSAIRGEVGIGKTPFFDSYHQVEIYVEQLNWVMGDTAVNMKIISGAGSNKAYFESVNYYKDARYERISGIADRSPLVDLKVFSQKLGYRTFYTEEYAKWKDHGFSDIKTLLISLGSQGFLSYDLDNEQVTLKDKLFFYIGAKFGNTDYDVLRFESEVQGLNNSNGRLSLGNLNMRIDGVTQVQLSDSQNVYIVPRNGQLTLKKDRNLSFAGMVYAGRFEFFGKDFAFDYQKFKVHVENIDSLRLKIPNDTAKTDYERAKLIKIKSVIEHVTGDLFVDNPKNKSGKVSITQYPIFTSTKDSYVYYDRPSIQGGVYKRDKFFFRLTPFSVDSLDNFTKQGLAFGGDFKSADIFPVFADTLRLQPDYSLGFVRSTPPEGLPMYKGKGNYTAVIDLSNRGLRGIGELKYLTSISKSSTFLFMPDSTNAIAEGFEVKKESAGGMAFPHVLAKDVKIHWEPYNDKLFATQRSEPFDIYDTKGYMTGTLINKPSGLDGNGTLSFYESELTSDQFRFKQMAFTTDTADFRMKSEIQNTLVFKSNNVNAKVNFETEIGDFKSNSPDDYITFPINQYICYIDKFKWLMGKKLIELGGGDMPNPKGYEYVSIRPDQDSLRFNSPKATFDVNQLLLHAKEVSEIYVADASIMPDSGNVYVEKEAHMRTLEKAKVLANVYTKYHNIFNAYIDIYGRKNYAGLGDYEYTNKNNLKQLIHLKSIKVDSMQTVATGEITEEDGFILSPQFSYKGFAYLSAPREHLIFDGYIQIKAKCSGFDKIWAKFKSVINPDSIRIPLRDLVDDKGETIDVGFGVAAEGAGSDIKGMFLGHSVGPPRDDFFTARGNMVYDKVSNEYRISSDERLADPEVKDNYMSYNDTKCVVFGEGNINLSNDWGRLKAQTIGTITQSQNSGETVMNAYLAVDFFFLDESWQAFIQDIKSMTLDPIDPENEAFINGINTVLGKKKGEEYITEVGLYGEAKTMPKELQHSLMFTNITLKWDPFNRAFRSEGKINVGSINKTQINLQMKGKIEIIKRNRGDQLNIYLESDELGWYYFSYENGIMETISSSDNFNDPIKNVKVEKTQLKAEKGQASYEYQITTGKKKDEFLRKTGYRSGR